MTTIILASLLLPHIAIAFNCSIPPVYIDMHYREVHGTDHFEWGSFLGVGVPSQNQSLWPSITQNETSVADINFCSNSSLADCEDSTNGFFEPSLSATWADADDYVSLDVQPEGDSSTFGTDVLYFFTHYLYSMPAFQNNITDLPIQLVQSGDDVPGVLGLGPKSTALQKMYDVGMIASRSFSMFLGTSFERAGGVFNGSITFGGYDSARFQGDTFQSDMDLSQPNPFHVKVTGMLLDDPTGLQRNVQLVSDGGFDAEISTDQYDFSLPADVTSAFAEALGANSAMPLNGSLQASLPFNGTLTVTLSNGFAISLPATTVSNISGITPVSAQSSNTSTTSILGGAWLSEVYLMADYETSTFSLAQVVQHEPWIETRTMCPGTAPTVYVKPQINAFIRKGGVGAIVGGFIGGLAISVIGIYCCVSWRLRAEEKKRRKSVRFFDGERGGVKVQEFDVEDDASLVIKWQQAGVQGKGERDTKKSKEKRLKRYWKPMLGAS